MQSMEIFIVIWWVRTAAGQTWAAVCALLSGESQPESVSIEMTVCKDGLQPKKQKKRCDAENYVAPLS